MRRLLVVGSGGREHALCWALRRELPEADIWCAPGNPGTATVAVNIPITADDLAGLGEFVSEHDVELTVVGPEAPLASGLADHLRGLGRLVFGPIASAARIEASKAFAKDVMQAAGVPTAASETFTELGPALACVDRHSEPLVVKASGLAAGKGAIVCRTRWEAAAAVRDMLEEGLFGDAGKTVVIEEFLEGEELSVFAVSNGREAVLLPSAQDHKRIGEGDQGPNTGGMGAYSPVSIATPALLGRVDREVIGPTIAELARRGAEFRGVLYAGLMIGPDGAPSVIEFNCRLGDPETQAILPLVPNGLAELFRRAAAGESLRGVGAPSLRGAVGGESLRGAGGAEAISAVTTVLAAHGYPDKPRKGDRITIPDDLGPDVVVFHAGTRRTEDGSLVTAGGRVLAVTGLGRSFAAAQEASRRAAQRIEFAGKQFRRDIGWREGLRA